MLGGSRRLAGARTVVVPLDLEPLRLESGCKAGAGLGAGCWELEAGTKLLGAGAWGVAPFPASPLSRPLDALARGP